jgi:hypothetical protein
VVSSARTANGAAATANPVVSRTRPGHTSAARNAYPPTSRRDANASPIAIPAQPGRPAWASASPPSPSVIARGHACSSRPTNGARTTVAPAATATAGGPATRREMRANPTADCTTRTARPASLMRAVDGPNTANGSARSHPLSGPYDSQ